MKDSHQRSLIKGITWRLIGTIDTIVISFLIIGKIPIALSIGGIEFLTKIVLFYLHERTWERIKWGKK